MGPDAYTYCPSPDFGFCSFHALLGAYGFVGNLRNSAGSGWPTQETAEKLLEQAYSVVAALNAPAGLWQPQQPALKGASSCDGLATAAQLEQAVGMDDPRPVKSDGGEYSTSLLDADRQVGGYWCTWLADTGRSSVNVSVLPGGATYLEHLRGSDAVAQPGVGENAYWSPKGELNIVDRAGWLQVSSADGEVTKDQLIALAKQVLGNLGG
ncbi:hypothetical protein ACFVWR_04080 [Leifsonia sp. NPDC058292]|uniref:hypothetical protein n=1 Tax=Leifsonia sp. NPDC058292 TaxID=3346428 RepID=UPI0036DE95D6